MKYSVQSPMSGRNGLCCCLSGRRNDEEKEKRARREHSTRRIIVGRLETPGGWCSYVRVLLVEVNGKEVHSLHG